MIFKDTSIRTTVPPDVAAQLREIAGTDDVHEAARHVLEAATRPTEAQLRRALKKPRGALLSSPRNDPTKVLRDMFARIDARHAADHGARK